MKKKKKKENGAHLQNLEEEEEEEEEKGVSSNERRSELGHEAADDVDEELFLFVPELGGRLGGDLPEFVFGDGEREEFVVGVGGGRELVVVEQDALGHSLAFVHQLAATLPQFRGELVEVRQAIDGSAPVTRRRDRHRSGDVDEIREPHVVGAGFSFEHVPLRRLHDPEPPRHVRVLLQLPTHPRLRGLDHFASAVAGWSGAVVPTSSSSPGAVPLTKLRRVKCPSATRVGGASARVLCAAAHATSSSALGVTSLKVFADSAGGK
eukprot:CAMPEP_0198646112 /NCGR_PEP_ID=MMETSP1467-20131203/1657_1 /TAXON_ID=1462469 /ORGANISM="unid. sp., Strain CCMP2135" /LENGTH=264 /DNA_ID=CAMNT_0044381625 /DNA_START=99 /DNA_END=892 /DNA_ORIENTATION=+